MLGYHRKQRLRELQAELAAISRSQAIIEFSPNGTIVTANENFLRVMGYTLSEIAGQHHSIFMPAGELQSDAYKQFWIGLGRGEFRAAEFKRIAKGGREVWLQATYNPVFDIAGKPIKVIKIAADVTQECLERADFSGQVQAIRRSQAVVEFTLDGTILTANENFLRTMGYSLPEIVGQRHAMFVAADDRDSAAYREFWAALGRGEYRAGEFKRIAKGGREVWLNATYNPIFDPGGKLIKVVKFGADVTAARLESTNNKGQIDAIDRSQAVIEFGLDGTILTANENFLRATGYSLAELVGKHHALLVNDNERNSAEYRAFWAALAKGEYRAGEFKRVRKDGGDLLLRATYNAIYDLNGKPVKVVKFATDVTEQILARDGFNALIANVVDAANKLSSSATRISAAMTRSQETADSAVQRAAGADGSTKRLRDAARAMGRVVDLITKITQQINLLALNATIESARAGEAGRGFAVVANEVKNLASQAKDATEEIAREIDAIRAISGDVVAALSAIKEAIGAVSAFMSETAAAVEGQSTVTEMISTAMRTAAEHASRLSAA